MILTRTTRRTQWAAALLAIVVCAPLQARAFDIVETSQYTMSIDPSSFVEGRRDTFFPASTETWLLEMAGTFSLSVTDYLFGCSATPFGNICADTFSTIQLHDPAVTVDSGADRAFRFPTYRATFNTPPQFAATNGPCAVTLPGEHCSGTSFGPLSSFDGSFDGTALLLTGSDPGALPGDVGYTYSIAAVAVPVPGALSMLIGPVALMGFRRRATCARPVPDGSI